MDEHTVGSVFPPAAQPSSPTSSPSAADVAGELIEDIERLRREVAQLQQAMITRGVIDQAKGILMHRFGIDAVAAFRVLARWSSVTNIRVAVVAAAVVELTGGDPSPSGVSPELAGPVGRMLREVDGNRTTRSVSAPH